jgi:hypothetical protein
MNLLKHNNKLLYLGPSCRTVFCSADRNAHMVSVRDVRYIPLHLNIMQHCPPPPTPRGAKSEEYRCGGGGVGGEKRGGGVGGVDTEGAESEGRSEGAELEG